MHKACKTKGGGTAHKWYTLNWWCCFPKGIVNDSESILELTKIDDRWWEPGFTVVESYR